MATLAQINETLRDQTSSIEDGTRTTAGLRDRFGEFLDRQRGSGDKREDEIEARQKERRQRIIAQRPQNFSQGLMQGLGFGPGFGFGAIAQKILGAMGLAAGAIGLGAGKLLRLGPAIAVMSKFGEQAIAGLIDYVDKEIKGIDFSKQAKEDLTKGAQFSLAARFLGFRHPLAIAMAGLVGAYGDEVIDLVNKKLKNEDGKYKLPFLDVEIDTQTQGFQMAVAYAAAAIAPTILGLTGTLLKAALRKVPLGKAGLLVSAAVASFFGLKGGPPPDPNEIRNNKKPPPVPKPANLNVAPLANAVRPGAGTTMAAANNNVKPKVPFKFPQLDGTKEKLKNLVTKLGSFDAALKVLTKGAVPAGFGYEIAMSRSNPNVQNMDPVSAAVTAAGTEMTLGFIDILQDQYNKMVNLTNSGINYGLRKSGFEYQLGYNTEPSDLAGGAQRLIAKAYGNYLQNPPVIGPQPPNVGLTTPDSYNPFPNGQVQFNDLSNNQQNRGGDMNVISVVNSIDMGSKVVSIGKD